MSFLNNKVLNPFALPGAAEYYYPMNQSARFLWYHDHAVGITRLNAYAGIASGMLIRDSFEANLINQGLPNYIEAGGNEIPLVIQDKIFVGPDISQQDPIWSSIDLQSATRSPAASGMPTPTTRTRWDAGIAPGGLTLPDPSSIPEFFGDTMLVNGTTFPQATVQARRYRLRLLNACNARFLNLQLYVADGSPNGITLDADGNPDQHAIRERRHGRPHPGCRSAPRGASWRSRRRSRANRSDRQSDPIRPGRSTHRNCSSRCSWRRRSGPTSSSTSAGMPGKSVILYNDAPAPFPGGDDRNDYFPGFNWTVGTATRSTGPHSTASAPTPGSSCGSTWLRRQALRTRPLTINTSTDLTPGIDPFLLPPGRLHRVPHLRCITTRFLTLNEYFDEYGRLIQILGNAAAPFGSPYFGTADYLDYGHRSGTTVGLPRRTSTTATRKCGRSTTPPATCTRCTSTW